MKKGILLTAMIIFISLIFYSCADIQQAKIYYSQSQYEKASKELMPLVRKDFPQACYLMGKMILENNLKEYKPEYGIRLLKKAYELGYWKAARELGFYFLNKGKPKKSLYWFEKAKQNGDTTAEIEILKLNFLLKTISHKNIEKLELEAKKDPRIYNVIGDYYALLSQLNKAASYYKAAYRRGYIKAGIKLARIYFKLKQTNKAINLARNIYLKYKNKQAALIVGKIYEYKGKNVKLSYCPILKFQDAKTYFKAQLKLKNKKDIYRFKALMWYKSAMPLNEADYRYMRIKWILDNNTCGNYFIILKFTKMGIKAALSDIKRLYYSGRCKLPHGSKVSQEQNKLRFGGGLLSTTTLASKSPATKYYETGIQLLQYNKSKALEYLKKACEYGSISAEIELALLKENQNPNLSAAVLYYYAAVKNIPKAMLALAKLYFSYGYDKEALKWLNRAAKKLEYTPARAYLAEYLLNHGKEKEAIQYLSQLEKEKYCFASILLGALYEGDYGDMDIDFKKAFYHYKIALTNECPESYFRLAKLYTIEGDLKKALVFAKKYAFLRENQIKAFILLSKIETSLENMKSAATYMEIAINKGYSPNIGDIEKLFPYLNTKILLSKKIRLITYTILARKLYKYNFNLSFCMAYKAAMNSVHHAAIVLFKIGIIADTEKEGYFVKKVSINPYVCNVLLRKNKTAIKQMINILKRRILFENIKY